MKLRCYVTEKNKDATWRNIRPIRCPSSQREMERWCGQCNCVSWPTILTNKVRNKETNDKCMAEIYGSDRFEPGPPG